MGSRPTLRAQQQPQYTETKRNNVLKGFNHKGCETSVAAMNLTFSECDWHPRHVIRAIRSVKSSTEVIQVELDSGNAYLKGMGNPQGDECLAFELVGTRLARLAKLFVPDYGVFRHEGLDLIRISGQVVETGPVFVSLALPGLPGGGGQAALKRVENRFDIPLLVAFDTWLRNADRCPPATALDPRPNWDNIFFVPLSSGKLHLAVFDHTHCFAEGALDDALESGAYLDDAAVYGAFPEFMPFLTEDALRGAVHAICAIDCDSIERVVHEVPVEWGITGGTRSEWLRQIIARRGSLEEILLDNLLSQRVMEFR